MCGSTSTSGTLCFSSSFPELGYRLPTLDVLGEMRPPSGEILPAACETRVGLGGSSGVVGRFLVDAPAEILRRFPAALAESPGGSIWPGGGVSVSAMSLRAPPSAEEVVESGTEVGETRAEMENQVQGSELGEESQPIGSSSGGSRRTSSVCWNVISFVYR